MRTPNGNEYNIKLVRMPPTVRGAVVLLCDDTYDIFINCADPTSVQENTLEHEIAHIDRGHLYNDIDPVVCMEREASKLARRTKLA